MCTVKKKIFFLLFLLSISQASSVYNLDLTIWKNDSVQLNHFSINAGTPGYFPQQGDEMYEFRLLSEDGTNIYSKTFYLTFVTYPFRGPNSTEPGEVNISKIDYQWELPYDDNATSIQLFHDDKKIFEYGLPRKEQQSGSAGTTQPEFIEWNTLCLYGVLGAIFIVLALLLFRVFGKNKKE